MQRSYCFCYHNNQLFDDLGYLIRVRDMPHSELGTWDGIWDDLEDQHLFDNPGWRDCWILIIPGNLIILISSLSGTSIWSYN